jgi:hypothetical protein
MVRWDGSQRHPTRRQWRYPMGPYLENLHETSSRLCVFQGMARITGSGKLQLETWFVGMQIFDRFLSLVPCRKDLHWADLGLVCLSLAHKMLEEASDGLLTLYKDDRLHHLTLVRLELMVLDTMVWSLGAPSPLEFLVSDEGRLRPTPGEIQFLLYLRILPWFTLLGDRCMVRVLSFLDPAIEIWPVDMDISGIVRMLDL